MHKVKDKGKFLRFAYIFFRSLYTPNTDLVLGFRFWFLLLVFFSVFPLYFSRLGRMFRVTAKVRRSRQKFWTRIGVTAKIRGIVSSHGKAIYSSMSRLRW